MQGTGRQTEGQPFPSNAGSPLSMDWPSAHVTAVTQAAVSAQLTGCSAPT